MTWIVCLKSKIISLKVGNIAAIKKKYAEREAKSKKAVSQTEVRRALHNELLQQGRFASVRSPFGRG